MSRVDSLRGVLTSDLAVILDMPARTVRQWAQDEGWGFTRGGDGRRYYDTADALESPKVVGRMKALRVLP